MKKNKKSSGSKSGYIYISRNDVPLLKEQHRWSESEGKSAAENDERAEYLRKLLDQPKIELKDIDVEKLTEVTSSDIIDKFLRSDNYRIVADENQPEADVVTEAEFSDEDDMVSEELAEVYLAQGLKDMAKETYRKLSLRNPEKSVYFAQLIEKIDN